MAILAQAGDDMINGVKDDKADGHMWVLSNDICFMSFNWFCGILGLSAKSMRGGILDKIRLGDVLSKGSMLKSRGSR